jgi:hypothetical protein
MRWLRYCWRSLTDEGQVRRLVLVGSALTVAVTGAWQLYLHFADLRPPTAVAGDPGPGQARGDGIASVSHTDPAAGGSVKVESIVNSEGGFSGESRVEGIVVECTDNTHVVSSITSQGDVTGTSGIIGGRFTGNKAENCE